MQTILLYVVAGATIGVASGALGIGGGILLVPVFMLLFRFDQPHAAGTSLAVLMLPVLLPAAWKYIHRDEVNIQAALIVGASLAVGGYIGASLQPQLPTHLLRAGLGLVLIYIGIQYFFGSDWDARAAIVGVIAVGAAWITRLWFRMLGKRYSVPSLKEEIQQQQETPPNEPEYYI